MEQEQFIVWSPDVPLIIQSFGHEHRAQETAEGYARSHRGARFYVARIVAFVSEPLPDLQWSDSRNAGSGKLQTPHDLGAQIYADTASTNQVTSMTPHNQRRW